MGITKEQFRDAISQVKTFVLGKTSNMVPKTRTINGKALSEDITLKASDIGADASGTAANQITSHNISTTVHNDIRLLIIGLTDRMNALANSDDITLDQMKEVVAYIKANRELIESITTAKINVNDIVDNLETNVANKPLSAAQGVVLKLLIDTLQSSVDTKINKREYVNSVIGTTTILIDSLVYEINCMVLPYPDATAKTVIPITIDIGVLKYVTQGNTYIMTYGGSDEYCIDIIVTVNDSNISVALRTVKWDGNDVTATARLTVHVVK